MLAIVWTWFLKYTIFASVNGFYPCVQLDPDTTVVVSLLAINNKYVKFLTSIFKNNLYRLFISIPTVI